jgi:glycine/D-amino acid oxidase-like deaminating enzyme
MQVDYLIIGQGISGTFLSYYLEKENKSFLVIDDHFPDAPSRLAAGIINPVTGRRLVKAWMIDELIPFVTKAYQEIGHQIGVDCISTKSIIDFFPDPFMKESFLKRMSEEAAYLHAYPEQNQFNSCFHYEFGCGEIRPAFTAHLEVLLPAWRQYLHNKAALLEEKFIPDKLKVTPSGIRYKDIIAEKIIFCDGAASGERPYFKLLPFAANKGEALILEIEDIPDQHIYKKGLMLVPMLTKNRFWLGSAYTWDFTDTHPTEAFRNSAELVLKSWVKKPYKITAHLAGLRPATLERRPFVGLHPLYPSIGILNGMGTKGCSLAPYFAKELTDHLVYQMTITPEADVARFKKILAR